MTVVTPLPFVAVSEMRPVYFVGHPPGPYLPTLPLPPRVVLGKYLVFNGLAALICGKRLVLRYLESKYLKTRCLFGGARCAGRAVYLGFADGT
jgi:hypothetical protein